MHKLKLVKTSPCNPSYLAQFYSRRPGLESLSYSQQYAALMGDCYGMADFWKMSLESAGLCDVTEIIYDAIALQEQWWRENVNKRVPDTLLGILEKQLLQLAPDIWYCHAYDIPPEFRVRIRKRLPNLKIVIGEDGVAWHNPAHFVGCDVILTCLRRTEAFYSKNGFRAYYLGGKFAPIIRERVGVQDIEIPVSFTGSLWMGGKGHFSRLRFLDNLSRKRDLNLHLSGVPVNGQILARAASCIKKGDLMTACRVLSSFGSIRRLSALSKAPLFGLEMYRCLARSNIVLNYHIDAAGGEAANMRLYEATGMGTCLLTDYKPNLETIFVPNEEVVVFKSVEECLEKIDFLERHPEVRNRIATAGKRRTDHNYSLGKGVNAFVTQLINTL